MATRTSRFQGHYFLSGNCSNFGVKGFEGHTECFGNLSNTYLKYYKRHHGHIQKHHLEIKVRAFYSFFCLGIFSNDCVKIFSCSFLKCTCCERFRQTFANFHEITPVYVDIFTESWKAVRFDQKNKS